MWLLSHTHKNSTSMDILQVTTAYPFVLSVFFLYVFQNINFRNNWWIFLQTWCPSSHSTNSVKLLHVQYTRTVVQNPAHTHTHPFNSPLSRTTRVGRYQKGKTNLDFTEARDSEWQW